MDANNSRGGLLAVVFPEDGVGGGDEGGPGVPDIEGNGEDKAVGVVVVVVDGTLVPHLVCRLVVQIGKVAGNYKVNICII